MNFASIIPHFAVASLRMRDIRPQRRPAAIPATPPLTLSRHATMRLQNTRLELRVLRGCVWITRDGCLKDLVLEAGDVFEQQPGAPVLVHALNDADLLIALAGAGAQNR